MKSPFLFVVSVLTTLCSIGALVWGLVALEVRTVAETKAFEAAVEAEGNVTRLESLQSDKESALPRAQETMDSHYNTCYQGKFEEALWGLPPTTGQAGACLLMEPSKQAVVDLETDIASLSAEIEEAREAQETMRIQASGYASEKERIYLYFGISSLVLAITSAVLWRKWLGTSSLK